MRRKNTLPVLAVSLLMVCFLYAGPVFAAKKEVLVFAAASTTNALTDIGKLYASKGLGTVAFSFASSSTLAKQIDKGAPAHIFLSANPEWMDFLEKKGLLVPGSRADLLGNSLALIAPKDSKASATPISPQCAFVSLLGAGERLAVGDPAHVPAGMYGEQALRHLGCWEAVKDRLAPAKDVRAALALVEQGEAPLGIVYSSDAAGSQKVRTLGLFPEGSHPPVVYPVAVIQGDFVQDAEAFLAFLRGPEAQAVFAEYGFTVR